MKQAQLGTMIAILAAGLLAAGLSAGEGTAGSPPSEAQVLLDRLGDADYRVREEATRAVLEWGPAAVPLLEQRLAAEADAEIRFRLAFILENIAAPAEAVLVVRADEQHRLAPGDLITHVNNRRVTSRAELLRRLQAAGGPSTLRVRRPTEREDVGRWESGKVGRAHTATPPAGDGDQASDLSAFSLSHVSLPAAEDLPTVSEFRSPRGPAIAQIVRLFADGYAEQAYELLQTLSGPVPEAELSPLLRAIMAYTAGDAQTAERIILSQPEANQPLSVLAPWTSPSPLDLAGPGEAPLHLEWRLWMQPGGGRRPSIEPDVAIQRVLVPANRFDEALSRVATMWWTRYRPLLGSQEDTDRVGGNMLAVAAWMLSELDLQSECLRLIEPRSEILRNASQGVRKWVRVRTDAWLPFIQGQPEQALESFYEDARGILQPPGPPPTRVHIQNPAVAATIAFFLYQLPADPRRGEMLELVNRPDQPAMPEYLHWMLFALRRENESAIRTDLARLLPNAPAPAAVEFAAAAALLAYIDAEQPPSAADLFHAAAERLAAAPDSEATRPWRAALEALQGLAAGRAVPAAAVADEVPGAAALRATAEFLTGPAAAATDAAVRQALLAVPVGPKRDSWLLLTRERTLRRYWPAGGRTEPVAAPTPTWFPGPLTWPWLGHEPATGRVWLYDRRRIVEVCEGERPPVRVNVAVRDVPAFERYVAPVFSAWAQTIGPPPDPAAEPGEFWCDDVRAGGDYFADPFLPEIAFIRPLPEDARVVHTAIRGGAQLLIETATGRTWSSPQLAQQLAAGLAEPGAAEPLRFVAQAAREQPTPLVFLLSNVGLVRFDMASGAVGRIALPGAQPFPALVPESCPYERRDPRWLYCARLPADGGQVYRLRVADSVVEPLGMVNEALPREFFAAQSRSALRRQIDEVFAQQGLPNLRALVADAQETVARYVQGTRP